MPLTDIPDDFGSGGSNLNPTSEAPTLKDLLVEHKEAIEDLQTNPVSSGVVETVVAGDGIAVDVTDPANPIISTTVAPCDFDEPSPSATRIVRLVSTANIALTGVISIDSVNTTTNDRILVAAQTVASQNGLYVANNAGAWTRVTDFNDGTEMSAGTAIFVTGGVIWGFSTWRLTNLGAIVIGTTSLVFKPVSVNFDPNPGIGVSTAATIGVGELRIQNPGTTATIASLRSFSSVALFTNASAGIWLGSAGYKALASTLDWISFQGSQGKMTGVPANADIGGAFPGAWVVGPDMTNFKLYAYDAQTGGSWKCYGEAYTALKRGTNLTNADATIQPFTDKASRYDLPAATLTTNRTLTLGVTSVITGTKVTITRRDATANTYAIVNGGGGAGTKYTFLASPTTVERATFRFDGTNWALVDFEYVEA